MNSMDASPRHGGLSGRWRSSTKRLILVYGVFFVAWTVVLIGAISWLLDAAPGDSTPNPDVSQREEELARKAAAAAPASDASKPSADKTPKGPTVPEGFSIHTFVAAPDIQPGTILRTANAKIRRQRGVGNPVFW